VKKNRGKAIVIVLCILLSLYFLYPTYKDYRFTKDLVGLVGADSAKFIEENENAIRTARMERIKLGLDLQGGMRVVLEVNVLKLLEDLAKNKDDVFNQIVQEVRDESRVTEIELIDRLAAGFQARQVRMSKYYGTVREDDAAIISKLRTESNNAVDRAMEIVRNRVDQYGVSEPSIQKQGGRRIIVELPGVSKEAEVRQLLQGTALLEFKLLIDPEIMVKLYDAVDKTLAGKPLDDTTKTDTTSLAAKDTAKSKETANADTSALPEDQLAGEEDLAKAKKEHPFFVLANPFQQENQGWSGQLYTSENDRQKVLQILQRPDIKRLMPNNIMFLWSAKPEFVAEGKKFFALYAVKEAAELTGGVVTGARATIDPNFNTPIVTMQMNTEGAREWARITGANVDKRLAIIMDNAVFSAPVVRSKITGGNSQIEGMDNVEEAKLLEIVLKAGALPAPVEIIQQTSVGPSLGEDSIRAGVSSSLLALLLTVAFMIFYYKMGGTMADVALVLNLLFTMAVIAGFKGTLTLPGIAGIILTMAVAVDANVLIYERIREESVTGKTMAAILEAGYGKAFTAIFDSNVTTFITGVILYQFGSGPIQGFALTLMIGIVASMFSAIVITRVIFEWMNERGMKLNFG
jgi:preprotein translocase subunit SecD